MVNAFRTFNLDKIFELPFVTYWVGFLLVVFGVVYNVKLLIIYSAMLLISAIGISSFGNGRFLVNSVKGNTLYSVAQAVFALLFFFVLSVFVLQALSNFAQNEASLNAVLGTEGIVGPVIKSQQAAIVGNLQSSTLPLAGNVPITLTTFGIIIPFIETLLVASLLVALIGVFGVTETNAFAPRLLAIFTIIAAVLTVVHFTAKGVDNVAALTTTFVFFWLNPLYIFIVKELEGPFYMHAINNLMSLLLGTKG